MSSAEKKLTEKNCDYIIANTLNNIASSKRSFTVLSKHDKHQTYKNLNVIESAEIILKTIATFHSK